MSIQEPIIITTIVLAVLGNVVAFVIAARKGLKIKNMWAGTPFYIYSVCRKSPLQAGHMTTYLALISSILFVVVFLLFLVV